MANEQDREAWVNMVTGSTYREVTPMQKTTPEMRLKTFTGFLKFAEIDSNSKKSKLLFEIWNEAGAPILKYGKRPMVNLDEPSARATYATPNDQKLNLERYDVAVATIYDVDDFLAEMSHGIQYTNVEGQYTKKGKKWIDYSVDPPLEETLPQITLSDSLDRAARSQHRQFGEHNIYGFSPHPIIGWMMEGRLPALKELKKLIPFSGDRDWFYPEIDSITGRKKFTKYVEGVTDIKKIPIEALAHRITELKLKKRYKELE
jgi:hypothetical protein